MLRYASIEQYIYVGKIGMLYGAVGTYFHFPDRFGSDCRCRYRNFLMVCTALMEQNQQPMYFALLDHPIPPGVKNLQRWIEAAWRNGLCFLILVATLYLCRMDRI